MDRAKARSADEIMEVAQGKRKPWSVEPYFRWQTNSLGQAGAESDSPETDAATTALASFLLPNCEGFLTGAAYDRDHQLLYVSQYDAISVTSDSGEKYPAIHVFAIGQEP